MGKRKIKVNLSTLMQNVLEERPTTFNDLIDIHKQFVEDKKLEGISDRTIEDYYSSMKYFKKFLDFEYRTEVDQLNINTRVLKNYMSYMLNDKGYAPCTVNIRLKNLKTFFKWAYNNGHIKHDIALNIKTVKAPLDTVTPLDERTIKKLLNNCDLSTYAGFRDFCAIVTVLDCGIRGNELVQLKSEDVDFNKKLIRIRADVSKTRTERFLPISSKTTRLLKELVNIGTFNGLDNYVFQSTYGGSILADNLNMSLNRVKNKAGIENQRVTLYVLRHIK